MASREPPIYDWNQLWDIVDVVNAVAAEHGVSGAQVGLAWLLQRPTRLERDHGRPHHLSSSRTTSRPSS